MFIIEFIIVSLNYKDTNDLPLRAKPNASEFGYTVEAYTGLCVGTPVSVSVCARARAPVCVWYL